MLNWSEVLKPLDDFFNKIEPYKIHIISTISIVVALSVGTFGYFYYKQNREERAFRALTTALEYFDAPITKAEDRKDDDLSIFGKKEFSNEQEKWQKVESVFREEYNNFRNSNIASFFLAYQAEALIKQSKLHDAAEVLSIAIPKMSDKDAKSFYNIKLALVQIDTKENVSIQNGLERLRSIASEENNPAHDLSLYHLGEYYWNQKNFKEAKNYWNQLVLKYDQDSKYPSPWSSEAKKKLKLIDRDVK